MKNTKWKRLLIGMFISLFIEISIYLIYPALYEVRQHHQASVLDSAPIFYLTTSILAAIMLLLAFTKKRDVWTKLAIISVLLSLSHGTFVLWTIKCSCGDA